ncbi:MAG: glycosyltransferase [Clostridia bacterium]|nr:glycosyltransferase [Clostridia bacterium]
MPKVSVIVPVYNVEPYLEKCIDTLVNQTINDIEIILVNDGSTDHSKKIIEEKVKQFPNKIVYLEKENGGLSDARNYGMPYAKGEYVAFLDSDDYVEKDMYEKMYQLAKKENSDMVECDFYWEYSNKQKEDRGEPYQGKKEMLEKIRVVAWNKLIKREILEESNVKFPKGYRYEDVEFTYLLIPFLEKVSFLKRPCIHYIQREGSISNLQNERTKEIFDVLEHVIKAYQKKGIYETYQMQLEYVYVRYAFCSSFLRMVKIPDKIVREKLLKETWEQVNQKFPNWKNNEILKKHKNAKNLYMKTLNKVTYKIYSQIFRRIK